MARTVPLSNKVCVLFGGFLNQFGWAFLGFGLIFCQLFLPKADFSSWKFSGELQSSAAKVFDIVETSMSVNDRRIFEYHYEFEGSDGQLYRDFSYAPSHRSDLGKMETAEYPKGEPSYSRLRGMRRKPFGPFVLFVLLFPLVGGGLAFFGLKKGLRAMPLLKEGLKAFGRLVSKEPTNTRVNDRTVYKMTFSFRANDGQEYTVTDKTHEVERLEDDDEEPLLYLEDCPHKAVLLDSLPGSPQLDDRDQWVPVSPIKAAKVAILPLLTLGGHGFWFFMS